MRIGVAAVGRLKAGPESTLAERYLDRARAGGRAVGLSGFAVVEVPESREGDAGRRRDAEAAALTARVVPGGIVVALDEHGTEMTSAELAARIGRWRDEGAAEAVFLVGGPDGLGGAAREAAALTLAFGRMTWPHRMVRAMLAEQLYRATTILGGHPYHRT